KNWRNDPAGEFIKRNRAMSRLSCRRTYNMKICKGINQNVAISNNTRRSLVKLIDCKKYLKDLYQYWENKLVFDL
ncbi:21244_t:CDS:2, partial [Gigaspora margarita]